MIRINLLPPEYRKVERTPIGFFVAFLIAVVLAFLGILYTLFMHIQLKNSEEKVQQKREMVENLKKQVQDLDELRKQVREFSRRQRIIMTIRAMRIYWSRKLSLLGNMTPPNIWLTKADMKQEDPVEKKEELARKRNGGTLEVTGFCRGTEYKPVADYRELLKRNRLFFYDFFRVSPPGFDRVKLQNVDPVDRDAIKFTMTLELKPRLQFQPEE
ncbi:MAG: hypothetical protein DRP63_06210 [Planctomycetota bacterium]|nr:MAG: hypothetical protein DRP63_06210 [Planctomycetota bacterium]